VLAGERCDRLLSERVQRIPSEDVQCDEIWGFVQKKEAHKWPWEAQDDKRGDAYCFVAIERNTKLVLAHRLGRRTDADTQTFIKDLRRATANGHASGDPVNERILEEMEKLESCVCFAFCLLQLLPGPFDIEDHACNGGKDHRPYFGHWRIADGSLNFGFTSTI
jgi:hypothetical protein